MRKEKEKNNLIQQAQSQSPTPADESAAPQSEKAPAAKAATKAGTGKLLLHLLIKIGVVAAVLVLVFSVVLCVDLHYGNNMHPAVRDGDLCIAYRLQKPYINAVVLYEGGGKTCVGRVVALEGDVIDISPEGALKINGVNPAEEVFYPTVPAENAAISYPYTVESGKAFILNDFRTDTGDSRSFGAVELKAIKGNLLLSLRHRDF